MPQFFSIQSPADAARLAGGGQPWPSGLQRANLGPGWYAWGSLDEAERYREILRNRGVPDLAIVIYEVSHARLATMKMLDLTLLNDDAIDEWMGRHSHYGSAEPHAWEHVMRNTDKGIEHYFARAAFALLTEVQ